MKQCHKCNRTYSDDSLAYCLEDGALLSAPYQSEATQVLPRFQESEVTRSSLKSVKTSRPRIWYLAIAIVGIIFCVVGIALLTSRNSSSVQNNAPPAKSPEDGRIDRASSDLSATPIQAGEIEQLIQGWQHAWESKDLNTFGDYYDDSFLGRNYSLKRGYRAMTRSEWIRDKQQKFARSNDVSITFGPRSISYEGNDVVVKFEQAYSSLNYSDRGDKTIWLRRKPNGVIKIIREDFSPVAGAR